MVIIGTGIIRVRRVRVNTWGQDRVRLRVRYFWECLEKGELGSGSGSGAGAGSGKL